MKLFVAFLCFVSFSPSFCSNVAPGNYSWDFLIFTQIWPASVCYVTNLEKPGSCEFPSTAKGWTIHGLWPSRFTGEGPAFCHTPQRHFNVSKLDPIKDKLEIQWPNILEGKSVSSLWKHEWEKHGSCITNLTILKGEINYFSHTLLINKQFDIFNFLKQYKIVPGTKQYETEEIEKALKSGYKKMLQLHCIKSKKEKSWYLSDIRLCLDKNLTITDCPKKAFEQLRYAPKKIEYYSNGPLPQVEPCPAKTELNYPISSATKPTLPNRIWTWVGQSIYFLL